jgi:TonB family protein
MIKKILFLFVGLIVFQAVHAERDTLLYCMKNKYELAKKDSAHFFLFIMPADSVNGKYVYPIKEFYPNGKPKLMGYSSSRVYNNLIMVETCMEYFSNGAKKSIANYIEGNLSGDLTLYYPNKKLYAIETIKNGVRYLIECHDTTGKTIAEKGNGNWITYLNDNRTNFEEGSVKDSVEDGEWHEFVNDSAKYVTIYKNDKVISTTKPNQTIFSAVEEAPYYKGGIAAFYSALVRILIYPAVDRENNVQGRVLLTFVVEKDGTLTGIHAIKTPSATLEAAAIDAVKQLPPWIPGMQGGRPVRVQFTVPISFNIGHE